MCGARGPTAEPEPGPRRGPARKPRKRRCGKAGAPEAAQGAGRPPTAPERFSQNWKALRELLKQTSQATEKPPVSQTDSTKPTNISQRNRKEITNEAGREAPEAACQGAAGRPSASGSLTNKKVPALPIKAGGAERSDTGATKRTNGAVSLKRRAFKLKKRKTKEAPAAPAPALPTESDIWFDDVDPADIEVTLGPEAANIVRQRLGQSGSRVTLVKERAFGGLTKALAMDCEMVGVGPKGDESIAARVSLVNQYGKCVYDKYVRPAQPVTDYRTDVSGIRPGHLEQGEDFDVVQKEVADLLKGRILVGHALHNDLKVLFLDHPKKKIRDTQKYKPFKSQVQSGRPSLKLLAERILGIRVQQAEHCSIQDAQAAMRLYVMVRKEWERIARDRRPTAPAPDTRGGDV